MADRTFEYSYFIATPLDQLYAHLSEPESYASLSPIVGDMRNLQRGVNSEGQVYFTYDTVESLHFVGIIPYHNPIHVTITLTQPNQQLIASVIARFGVRMRFVFDFMAGDGGTTIRETVEAHTPRLVQTYVVAQAKAVQKARVGILKSRLELATA
jgi:Polyketide cyclase / dehydrase and lipid transport